MCKKILQHCFTTDPNFLEGTLEKKKEKIKSINNLHLWSCILKSAWPITNDPTA